MDERQRPKRSLQQRRKKNTEEQKEKKKYKRLGGRFSEVGIFSPQTALIGMWIHPSMDGWMDAMKGLFPRPRSER